MSVKEAAQILFRESWRLGRHQIYSHVDYPHEAAILARLEKEVATAIRDLETYKKQRAYKQALDLLMPGWFWVDNGYDDPFISNDFGEWVDWLCEKGLDRETAEDLVRRDVPTTNTEKVS